MAKRILITGGGGFIGSNLSRRLLAQGNDVVVVDNFFSSDRNKVAELKSDPKFTLVEHDIIEPFDVGAVDEVYHLACPASPPQYQKDPIYTTRVSVDGTLNTLYLAEKHGARFFFSSTSEVYGDPLVHPQVESYRGNVNSTGPRACYDEGKRLAESLCFDMHRLGRVDVRVVRIFNTYGPHMSPDDGRVVSNFIVQALKGQPLTIYGDGSQTRSFCYVSDLVSGFIAMMATPDFVGPVNLGNPSEVTVLDFAKTVIEVVGRDVPLVFHGLPVDDPTRRCPNIELAASKLGWTPAVDLRQGLELTVDYFSKLVNQ